MRFIKAVALVYFLFFFSTICCQENIEIEGAIKLQNTINSNPDPGTIRFNPETNDFEGWNGLFWATLTGFQFEIGEVSDADSNVYKTVKIGNQEWMAENLRTTRYREGSAIPQVTDNTDWVNANFGAWCWYQNNNSFEQLYGKLYNWFAVNDVRGLCPSGWHVPTTEEWTILTDLLGGSSVCGGPMKEAGTVHWQSPNMGAINSSGFTGLPGGERRDNGIFNSSRFSGYWWSFTGSGDFALRRSLNYNFAGIYSFNTKKISGSSVRCLRD